jgi:hypothetical protein
MAALSAVTLTVVHALIITSARFRIPLELLLIPHAGVATLVAMEHVREVLGRAGGLRSSTERGSETSSRRDEGATQREVIRASHQTSE